MTEDFNILITNLVTNSALDVTRPVFAHESYKINVRLGSNSNNENWKQRYKNNIRWDFGDGTVVNAPSATHYYKFPGKYKVSCILYQIDGTPVENSVTYDIVVREALPSKLEFVNPSSWKSNVPCCKNNNLGQLFVSISNNVKSLPHVSAIRRWTKKTPKEDSYFDINKRSYYHRDRYYTFLEKQIVKSKNNIDSDYINAILKPTDTFIPDYITVYGYFTHENNTIKLKAFAVHPQEDLNRYSFVIQNPNLKYNSNEAYSTVGDRANVTVVNISSVKSLKGIPTNATEIGKIGIVDIWYKNDFISTNDLIFEFKPETFKLKTDPQLAESYLNIPPLGVSFNTVEATLDNSELKQALTSNGLFNSEYIADKSNNRFIFSQNSPIVIETHLIYNLYLNYEIEMYNSFFIMNDSLDGSSSWNLYKHKVNSNNGPHFYELSKPESDETYSLYKLRDTGNIENFEYNYGMYSDYISFYRLTPLSPSGFNLYYEDADNERHLLLACTSIVSLEDLVLPEEKRAIQNTEDILNTYMQHPMYDEAYNLKTFLRDIFKNNDMLSYVTAKGLNILNDNVNYKTCYLDKFLSILEMMDEPATHFDISSFDRINELKEMVRILTMNYSELFGNLLTNEYDIRITHSTKGFNVSDQLEPNDIVLCEINPTTGKSGDIVAIRRGNKILPLTTKTPYLILKDDFTFDTVLVNFVGIEPSSIETFEDQSESWKENHEWTELHAYSFNDYDPSWGWVMNLPNEIDNKANKADFIDAYYSFYIFNPIHSKTRKYNFVEETTIPKGTDNNQISVEQWNDDYGFVYDCLMKILTYNLNLRDSN